jgi:hypothetical protein
MVGIPIKLTQLASTHNNVRTKEIIGKCVLLPLEGKRFTMTSEPLDPTKTLRVVTTSIIQSIYEDGEVYYFETENSNYKLEVLEESK